MKLGTREGSDLVITRTFRAPIDDVWAACTEPARMERWIGTWTGDPASGEISFWMTAEGADVPEEVYLVEACEPPTRFVVRSRDAASFSPDGAGPLVHWEHTVELAEADGVTTLSFRQAVPDGPVGADMVASVGPGWDYYLDRLVASHAGDDLAPIVFEPYLETSEHYRRLFG